MRPNALMTSTLAIALASCGGGDGGTTTPPVANRAPVFTSQPAVSLAENITTVYNATATDEDGNTITFSISGGADGALFAITPTGGLTFINAPDFENPADADGNNVYQVQLKASDGTASVTQDLAVTVTNAGADGFRVRRISAGFNQPLFAAARPGTTATNRMYVVEKGGLIRILDTTTGTIAATPFLDVSAQISTSGERGLLGMAFAPDYATSRAFYVFLTNTSGAIEIRKYTSTAAAPDVADPASSTVIITIPHPGADNHNGGWIGFGPDGNLYLAVGDGGGVGDPNNNAQNTNSLLGKILRINPASDAFPTDPARNYAIPATNPYATTGGAPEVWMTGLRNPFRASFDVTGALFIGDVGQDALEEINIVPSGVNSLNFGWRLREGTQPYNGGADDTKFTPPAAEYGHGNGPLQGNSITGGYVYRGPVEALQGQYFFGDFVNGNIWSIPLFRFGQLTKGQTLASTAFTQRRTAFTPTAGTINNISSFGTDEKGNLYIVDYDGEIYVVEGTA